jgi:Na+-transporting NADH:ubiquinone oxidoreductase subunit B
MLRRFLDWQLSLTEKGKPLHRLRPLISAGDTFLYEAPHITAKGPHIRDAIDVKRWMLIVVLALLPCLFMSIWNTGLQAFVYGSGDYQLMNEFLIASKSLPDYLAFAGKDGKAWIILKEGLILVVPLLILTYVVGGIWEAVFAASRGHEISEGFLVTGILYVLILPPTIPYWMAAVGISAGIVFGKELFGGSGMNIVNPALICRAFLFFGFPGRMTGNIWVGGDAGKVRASLAKMNQDAGLSGVDAYSQATPLTQFNVSHEIKRIHVDAIASNDLGSRVDTFPTIEKGFEQWNTLGNHQANLGELTPDQLKSFVTQPLSDGGLGLNPGSYDDAYHFSALNFGLGDNHDLGFFLGNKLGSIGETSTLACLLGALFLVYTGVGSWRTMAAMGLGAYLTAFCFEWGSKFFGPDGGAWNAAQFAFPAYKHLILGGLAFGLVFMATDPVSSPSMKFAKWLYGLLCGFLTIVFRVLNPAYPEGVMLAILIGNVFAPLIDYYVSLFARKRRPARVARADR